MVRILLVEDDRDLAHLVKEYLVLEGMEVTLAHDGKSGLDLALTDNYDVVVLDVMLPGCSGLHLLRKLRMTSSVGIIMLTARTEEVDRVIGLEHGADDYIAKPCSPRELVARIRAVLRRLKPSWEQNLFNDLQYLELGDVIIDKGSRRCSIHGEFIRLTDTMRMRCGSQQSCFSRAKGEGKVTCLTFLFSQRLTLTCIVTSR